ncbi:unnamed protein product [Chrysoparadoxa australica]
MDWRRETRLLALVKMGFRRELAEVGLDASGNGDVLSDDTLIPILQQLQPVPPREIDADEAVNALEEEGIVLESIYGTQFTIEHPCRWRIDVNLGLGQGPSSAPSPTQLLILHQSQRPVPLVLVHHPGLPPQQLTTLTAAAANQARIGMEGAPVAYEVVTWLESNAKALIQSVKKSAAGNAGKGKGKGKEKSKNKANPASEVDNSKGKWDNELLQRLGGAKGVEGASPGDGDPTNAANQSKEERSLQLAEKRKEERGEGADGADEAEWRMAFLKALNSGLDTAAARAAANEATGRKETPPKHPLKGPVKGGGGAGSSGPAPGAAGTAAGQVKVDEAQEVSTRAKVTRDEAKKLLKEAHKRLKKGQDPVVEAVKMQQRTRQRESAQKARNLAQVAWSQGQQASAGDLKLGSLEGQGKAVGVNMAGCKPPPSLAGVMEVVEDTKKAQPWLVAEEALDLPLPAVAQAAHHLISGKKTHNTKRDEQLQAKEAEMEKALSKRLHEGLSKKRRLPRYQEMLAKRATLPAYQIQDVVVSTIAQNQVTIISGETGSGKTTQVPQLVLDDLISSCAGGKANVVVTQPRRISAIGVATRIAEECCERVGQSVGYQIRLESKRSNDTKLLLCTTGVLLRRLQIDPYLASVSHVFVDEVHERGLDTDFLLIILRDLIALRPSLKVVLMSATLNAKMFRDYFGGAPIVEIPGRAHPVDSFYLEDALQLTGYRVNPRGDYACKPSAKPKVFELTRSFTQSTSANQSRITGTLTLSLSLSLMRRFVPPGEWFRAYPQSVHDSLAVVDETIVNYELIEALLECICSTTTDGAILVFLPGMMEITKVMEQLEGNKYLSDPKRVRVFPLHSSMSTQDQTRIFEVPPKGSIRKIICSTNLAETSITVEDCVYVIDTCRVKENRFDELNMIPQLVECWVSKASAKQRRGRAGRVRKGYCYHLCSSRTYEEGLSEFQLPEMLRVSLDELILQILLLDKGFPDAFLNQAVNPPTPAAIADSITYLCKLQATQRNQNGQPVLTALGYHLATLPVEPRIGKMMLFGCFFGCIEPALTIAASMSCRSPFFSPFDKREQANAARWRELNRFNSDHLTLLTAFDAWKLTKSCGKRYEREFLREHFLSMQTLHMIDEVRSQLRGLLKDTGFVESTSNEQGSSVQMIKAVVCAGLYPNVVVAPESLGGKNAKKSATRADQVAFRSKKGDVHVHPSSACHQAYTLDSRYAVYHEMVATSKVYIRDMTTVSPCILALCSGSIQVMHEQEVIILDKWLHFKALRKAATLVKYLRIQLERMFLNKITNPYEDSRKGGRVMISALATLLDSNAQAQTYSQQLLESQIVGVRQGGNEQGDRGRRAGRNLQVIQSRAREEEMRQQARATAGPDPSDGIPEDDIFRNK